MEQRAGELAAAHQHMRLRPLKRADSAARSRQFRTQIGACFWNHIGSVGLSRPEGAGLVIGRADHWVGPLPEAGSGEPRVRDAVEPPAGYFVLPRASLPSRMALRAPARPP